jgi:uncharacterized protein (TIGR02996 family)
MQAGERVRLRPEAVKEHMGKAIGTGGVVIKVGDGRRNPEGMILVQRDGIKSHDWYEDSLWESEQVVKRREELLETVRANPHDASAKLIYADWLGDKGEDDLAHAYRWMAQNGKWPYYRVASMMENRWAWTIKERVYHNVHSASREDFPKTCILPGALLWATSGNQTSPMIVKSKTDDEAILKLSRGLARLKEMIAVKL